VLAQHWRAPSTIIPGNHDPGHFDSTFGAPALVDLGDAVIMPLDTRYRKRALLFRALGRIGDEQMAAVEAVTRTARPVVVAMHHGPQHHPLNFLDGLVDRHKMLGLLSSRPNVHVCCGHDHRALDFGQVHVAASVAHHPDPLRLYDVVGGVFFPSYRSAEPGKYMTLGAVPPC
jgi:3',5'-cyclic AMP phosphodiesterase CpdA